jgi:16S rRNA C967 or C1407 C5-methylase (RsmB/RsmF family)
MEELDLSLTILSDILDNDVSFAEGLRKVFQVNVEKRPYRSSVAGLVGCELRHHLLFAYLCEPLSTFSLEEKRFLSLALADAYFFKRIPLDTLNEALNKRLGPDKMALAKPLLDKSTHPETFIPEDLPKSSNKYLSLRYNTPEWVLKIWEHFGFGTTYKILKKNNHPLTYTVRVASTMSSEELLNNNADYAKSPIDNILFYGGKIPLRKLQEWHDGKIYLEKLATKKIIDEYKISEPSEIFVYNGNKDTSLLREVIETYGNTIGINLGVFDTTKCLDILKLIRDRNLKNINFFSASPEAMDAAISRPQDLVIASPNSSNFDLIREYPDYLLHFKKEGMDELFLQEKKTLEGCSKFVREKGLLVYLIYTISKKEGHNMVCDFLTNHPEFALLKEEQLFPFDELDTSCYYAVMKKDTKLVKSGVPLANINVSENIAASSMSLKAK